MPSNTSKKIPPLPKSDYPTYSIKLPSTKDEIKFRPINVREEKILLMAMEGDDVEEITNATKQIIQNCVVKPVDFDVENTASFDIEYLMLQIRIKSIGEKVKVYFHGFPDRDECLGCQQEKEIEIDLTDVKISGIEDYSNKVFFNDEKKGLVMKPQTWKRINQIYSYEFDENKDDGDRLLELIASSIDAIFDGENIYSASDYSLDQLVTYIEELSKPDFQKVRDYFRTIPKLEHEIEIKCPTCGYSAKHVFRGLDSFFV